MSLSALGGASAKVWGVAIALACLASGASGCSSSGNGDGGTTGATYSVAISGFAFAPNPLVVPAGATFSIKNNDSTTHTATSEAAAGMFVNGQADGGFTFDTANIPSGATATVTVPAGLASGTEQPFFCAIHKGMMNTPNPVIRIQ